MDAARCRRTDDMTDSSSFSPKTSEKPDTPSKAPALLRYSALRYRAIPLRGKVPLVRSWQTCGVASEATAALWSRQWPGHGVGLVMGRGIVALDVDPRAGGDESLAALVAEYGELPLTVTARTGGGGTHFILAVPEDITITNSASRVAMGLDVKADRGQIAVWPTIHPDTGRRYEWVTPPWVVEPAPCPAWLLELMTTPKARKSADVGKQVGDQVSDVGKQVGDGSWPSEGSGYHVATLALAGALLRSGLLPRQVVELMSQVVPPRATPRSEEIAEAVADTERRIAEDLPVSGWPSLRRSLGDAGCARLTEQLGITSPSGPAAATPSTTIPATAVYTPSEPPPTPATVDPPPTDLVDQLRDSAVRWTTPHLLKKAGFSPLTLGEQVAAGMLSWDDGIRLTVNETTRLAPFTQKPTPPPEEILAAEAGGATREPYGAPGVASLWRRSERDGDPDAPIRYVSTPPSLPDEGRGWLVVAATGAPLMQARRALGARRAELMTLGELVNGDAAECRQVVVWNPGRIALAVERAPRVGSRSSGEQHAALSRLLGRAAVVVGVDTVATDLGAQALRTWTGRPPEEVTVQPDLSGWTYRAHAEDSDVLGQVVGAARRGDRALVYAPAADVRHVVSVLVKEEVRAEHWGTLETDPAEAQVWVMPLGSPPPRQLGRVATVAVLGRLSRAGWPEVLADILDAAPTSHIVHGRLVGGHGRATSLAGVDEEMADAIARQDTTRGWCVEPATRPAPVAVEHSLAMAQARVHLRRGSWGVGRTWRWAWLSHGGDYRRGEPDPLAPEDLHEAVVATRAAYEGGQLERTRTTPTGSRLWFTDLRGQAIDDEDRPQWMVTAACDAMGPGVVSHDPVNGDDPDRYAAIETWSRRSGRRRVVAAGVMVAMLAGAWRGACDRDIAEARTGYPGHAGGHAPKVAAGMIAGEVICPGVQAVASLVHPSERPVITGGVPGYADIRGGETAPEGVRSAQALGSEIVAICNRAGLPASSLPRGEEACQWLGAALAQAGMTTQAIRTVRVYGTTFDGAATVRRVRVYELDVAELRKTLRYARWKAAGRLGWTLPDPLDRTTSDFEWGVAVGSDGRWCRVEEAPRGEMSGDVPPREYGAIGVT